MYLQLIKSTVTDAYIVATIGDWQCRRSEVASNVVACNTILYTHFDGGLVWAMWIVQVTLKKLYDNFCSSNYCLSLLVTSNSLIQCFLRDDLAKKLLSSKIP